MIEKKFTVEKKEKMEYPPLPKDVYQVELLDITSEERATYDTKNKPEEEKIMETVLKFQFTLLEGIDRARNNQKLRGRSIWENFVPTYLYEGRKGKNKLYKITEALLGRELTPEDEATMDSDFLNSLIGSQIRVTVGHRESDGNVYDQITDYLVANSRLKQLSKEEIEKASVKKDSETKSKVKEGQVVSPDNANEIKEEDLDEINASIVKQR